MFIYTHYSTLGVETPTTLVNKLYQKKIQSICLIDEFGDGIKEFNEICKKRNIKASYAIPFRFFIEGKEEKTNGFFITAEQMGLEVIFSIMNERNFDYIPFLFKKDLQKLQEGKVYCFIKDGKEYKELNGEVSFPIMPVSFLSEREKIEHFDEFEAEIGTSVEKMEVDFRVHQFIVSISKQTIQMQLDEKKRKRHYLRTKGKKRA